MTAPGRYIPALDGLRGVAVLMVVAIHTGLMFGGYLGVDVFFVLSGYLITGILLAEHERTGAIRLGRFYWRRFLRLTPALLLMLAAYALLAPLRWPGDPVGRDVLASAAYVTDYTMSLRGWPKHLAHTWSLGVEEKFYLLWPGALVMALRAGWSRDRLAKTLVYAIALGLAWRAWEGDYYRFDCRLPGLLAGCWLAVARPKLPAMAGWVGAGLLAYVVAVTIQGPTRVDLSVPMAEIAAVLLVARASDLPFLHSPALVSLGRLSYGIYLWHYPIAAAMQHAFPPCFVAPVVFLASVAAAWVSAETVEQVRYWGRSDASPPDCTRPASQTEPT